MCGKFTQHYSWQQVHAFSQPLVVDRPDELVVSTPMRPAYIMRLDPGGQRIMVPMRWGFSGVNDKTPSKPRHIHARSETIDTLRTFAQAFQEARGILMVATFNEGEEVGSKTKQWVITPKDRLPIAIAVICEQWTNGTEVLDTFVMATTPPNALIARITDRMPAILPAGDVGHLAGRDPGTPGRRQRAAAHLRGRWQLDDGTATALEALASVKAPELAGAAALGWQASKPSRAGEALDWEQGEPDVQTLPTRRRQRGTLPAALGALGGARQQIAGCALAPSDDQRRQSASAPGAGTSRSNN